MENLKQLCKMSELAAEYRKKLVTADEAVKVVKSGDRVHYGLFCGIVQDLDKALAKRTEELHDVLVCDTIWAHAEPPAILQADPDAKHFKYLSTHMSGLDRKMNKEGRCWFVPVQFRENPKLWAENVGDIDVAMLQVAPMDRYGNFNFGPQTAEYWGIFSAAKKIILEVNEKQPVVQGIQNSIHISQVDMVVEGSNGNLPTLIAKPASDTEKKIAGHIVEKIRSGSTLQLGIGGMPNYVGSMISQSDINDLSVHTEMFVDAYVNLYNEGKLTGNKNIDKGKMVFTFAMGSQEVYDFLDNNPMGYMAPVDYVNSLEVIAANDNFVSINSCLQVDLFGQVNSESAGLQHIGGTGGQLDFVMGAFKSKGGQSFLCTPSIRVNKDGSKESLLTARLPEGSIVSAPRSASHYIVTEFGAVNMKGKSTWERAELLISIAHPEFQDELVKEAEKMEELIMKGKKLSAILLITLLTLTTILTGCGGGDEAKEEAAASDDTVYTMKWAHVSPAENDKQADAINEIIAKIEKESNGRIKIEHYPSAILGNEEEIFEGLQLGTIEIGTLSSGSLGGFYPGVLATSTPFLFQSREEAWDFFDSETADWLADQVFENTGVKCIGWAENGLRCFTTTKKQVKSPADLKGLNIRTQQNPVTMAMVESLGGVPHPIAFAELYTALSQGAVDGQENPPSLIYTQGLYEVQPFLTLDYHVYDFLGVFVNPAALDKMPADLQEIFQKNIDEFVTIEREKSKSYDERDIQTMKDAGVSVYELTDEEYQQMVDATVPVRDVVRELTGDEVMDKVLAQVEELRK